MSALLLLMLLLCQGCASDRPPTGGPADTAPLRVIWSDPAPSSVNSTTNTIRLTFSHYVAARQLLDALFITPPIGEYDISIRGKTAELKLAKALQPKRTYILTLNKSLSDSRGHTLPAPFSMAFSTGPVIENGTISGKVINKDYSAATHALILAFAEQPKISGTESLLSRTPDYIIQAESSGLFFFRHLTPGLYKIIAVNDRNNDMYFTAGSEQIGLGCIALVPTGTSELLLRFAESTDNTQTAPVRQTSASSETGGISGICYAKGNFVIVEALCATASYRTTASRNQQGAFQYFFPALSPGSYTISAYVPSGNNRPDPSQQWNHGSINPFQPAEPFGYYPEKVTVRAHWTTSHIDIHIKNPL